MNWMGKTSFLGIAFGDRSITVAEIAPARGGDPSGAPWEVRRAAEFVSPAQAAGLSSQADAGIAATGAALGRFLRENGFSAGRAVVGVPARWLVAREKEIPPSSDQQAAEVLRMQAERAFSTELGELACDYAGKSDPSSARDVLLMAIPKRQLDRVVKLVEAAGREVAAVMPSTLALAAAGASGDDDGLVLSLNGDAVELSARRGGTPRMLRHLAIRGPDLASQNGTRAAAVSSLAGEIRRTIAMMPRGTGARPPEALHLWDGIGLEVGDASNLARQAGVDLRTGAGDRVSDLASLGLATSRASDAASRFTPALALALAGAEPRAGAVDFLHPRLAAPSKRRIGRRGAWALALTTTATVALLALWLDVRGRESELVDMKTRLTALAPDLLSAEQLSQRIGTARGWYPEGRPAMLECVREMTTAFPDGGEAIYVTKFTLAETRKGTLAGRSPNRDLVLDLADRLNKNRNFAGVKLGPLDAGGSSGEVVFSISFTYQGAGLKPATAPARK